MHLTLNLDLLRWIDANKGDKSRAAFIVHTLKEVMQYTTPSGAFHTKGNNEENISNGANHAPKQN
jgi:hypothetical protein